MASQQRGVISSWKDERGFGFITPDTGGDDLFFHVTSLRRRPKQIAQNSVVFYIITYDANKKPRAVNIYFGNEPLAPVLISVGVGCTFFLILATATIVLTLSPWLFLSYLLLSGLAFFVYQHDKTAATKGAQRVPESNLHLLELLGGWPGALVAQWYFRHKNRKHAYQVAYWCMVALNIGALALYCVAGAL